MTKNRIFSLAGPIPAILLTMVMLAFFSASSAQATAAAQESRNLATPELILQALEAGQIDTDTANLFLAYALGDYEKLPQEYRSDAPWEGTLTLLGLNQALSMQSAGRYQEEIAAILAPGGACNTSTASLPNVSNSTHFHIEYSTIGGGLNISSYSTSLETVWTKEITSFGWSAPPVLASNPPPGNRYHVRIDNLGGGLYGFVAADGVHAGLVGNNPNTSWNDVDAFASCMVLNNDFSPFPGTSQQALDATAAHEFNHSIQFGYGVLSGSNVPDAIFIEAAATWMEDEVFDSANDNYNYLWPTFTMPMGNYNIFPYPYWITFRGITERYGTGAAGGGEQVMQDLLQIISQGTTGNGVAALNAALANRSTNLNDAFHAYAIAVKFNKTCGGSFVYPYCFEEASGYVGAAGATTVNGSIASVGNNYSGSVADSYAINWVNLPTGGSAYKVTLQNTSAGGSLRGSIICDTGSALNITAFPLVVGTGSNSSISSFNPSGCNSVVGVITNQSTATTSTARSYTLSTAGIIPPPGAATLVTPSGAITDTTPTYTWNKVNAATWYYLWVNNPSGTAVIKQWYQSSAVCGASTCSATPSTVLGSGNHQWWIQTWNDGGYGPWSSAKSFSLPAAGFNSQFNGSTTGWQAHSGSWSIDSSQWYTAPGLANLWASASYNGTFSTLDYQARLWRSGDNYASCLVVRGSPTPPLSDNDWDSGYSFCYTTLGAYNIWKSAGGGAWTELQPWTNSPSIITGGAWNNFRIVANGSNLYFYINGALVWAGVDTSRVSGRVGIEFYSPAPVAAHQLWVDWATLTNIVPREILDTISPEQQALNEAAQEGGASNKYYPSAK